MQAVILAGGKGSRLQPFTNDIPKPLVEIDGRPIVEYLLERLKKFGVNRATLAVNHLADKIESKLGDGKQFGVKLNYSQETRELSTIAPLKLIDDLDDNFIVVNGDVLTDLNFKDMFQTHLDSKSKLTVAVHQREHKIDYGVITADTKGVVTSFSEKPVSDYLVSMGVYVFSKDILDIVPDDQPYGFDELMLLMLKQKQAVLTYQYDGYWRDIGRIEDYMAVSNELDKIRTLLK